MYITGIHCGCVVSTLLLALSFADHAAATTTTANVSAFVSGHTVSDSDSAGAGGAHALASQTIPTPAGGIFVTAEASSAPGAVRATGDVRTYGGGGLQAQGKAIWVDTFAIQSAGMGGMTGTFSGSVQVNGSLIVEITGRSYADTQIYADVSIETDTGPNGGSAGAHGSARHLIGYDIGDTTTGNASFTLQFLNVPFTFGSDIDVSLQLFVTADVNAVDGGATGRALADYGHTMSWGGLSQVRDSSGNLLTGYTAVSAGSGFNFATPVPEPGSGVLLLAGLLVTGCWRRAAINSAATQLSTLLHPHVRGGARCEAGTPTA